MEAKSTLTERVLKMTELYYNGDLKKALEQMINIGCTALEIEAEENIKIRKSEFTN